MGFPHALQTLAVGTAAMIGPVAMAAPASAAAPEFVYQVTRHATYRDIPGTGTTFTATAGAAHYLWTRNLSTHNVTPLSAGDNIGNTFAIRCRDGADQPVPGEQGAYWAANLVPPGETSVTPILRWLFVAPTTGIYTCLLSIASYSTIIEGGRSVTMRIPAGAELARSTYHNARRWTLQAADATVVTPATTLTTLGTTYPPAAVEAGRIAVTQDAALTTCKAGSSVPGCYGGSSANPGTTIRTWIEALPQTSAGTACGTRLTSPAVTRSLSTAKHHLSATNTLYLTKSQLVGCVKFRTTLKVQNVKGNPVLVHGGYSTALAATHGVAFEYS